MVPFHLNHAINIEESQSNPIQANKFEVNVRYDTSCILVPSTWTTLVYNHGCNYAQDHDKKGVE